MDLYKPSLLGALLCGFFHISLARIRDCSGACTLQFRCDPYAKNLIWAVSGGDCRVFQNSCLFGSHNCLRENECLQPLVPINKDKCMAHCPGSCSLSGLQVCASFSYVDINGVKRDRQMAFQSRCHLNQYACENSNAYIGDPSIGSCS
ncbi:salivary glue protein Sgs-5 [Drosophila gunungcola]|uniref:salivary glue protein Sgs-5 n=1 Tax=Drosophila gunungcola TaxID=103775 RepID=UPI0022E7CF23|nr:salivary glue protein Sgs-5 [Drosophila gunungcola]